MWKVWSWLLFYTRCPRNKKQIDKKNNCRYIRYYFTMGWYNTSVTYYQAQCTSFPWSDTKQILNFWESVCFYTINDINLLLSATRCLSFNYSFIFMNLLVYPLKIHLIIVFVYLIVSHFKFFIGIILDLLCCMIRLSQIYLANVYRKRL